MPFPRLDNSGKPIAATNHRKGFHQEMREITSYCMNMNELSTNSSMQL
jgi:hypothetical protein